MTVYLGSIPACPIKVITEDTFKAYFENTLTNFNIPSGVTTILANMFENKTSLNTITIPNTVTAINNYAFRNSGITKIIIPDSVTTLGSNVFESCDSLTEASIGTGIISLGTKAFNNTAIKTIIIPNNITSIGTQCFQGTDLVSITIPNSVTTINSYAFMSCYDLESFTFEEGSSLATIEQYLFMNDSKLTELKFPSTITRIRAYAFSNCTGILKYDFTQCTQVPTLDNRNAFNAINANCKIYVPDSLYDTWIGATNWSNVASYIVRASEMV